MMQLYAAGLLVAAATMSMAGCRAPETIVEQSHDTLIAQVHVRTIADDASDYMTEQRQQVAPRTGLLLIAGVEPEGRFIWEFDLSDNIQAIEGSLKPMQWLHPSISPHQYVRLVLAIFRAPLMQQAPALPAEQLRVMGDSYVAIAADMPEVTFYRNTRTQQVDIAVLRADGYTIIARGMNYRTWPASDIVLPGQIRIYRMQPGWPQHEIMDIHYINYR